MRLCFPFERRTIFKPGGEEIPPLLCNFPQNGLQRWWKSTESDGSAHRILYAANPFVIIVRNTGIRAHLVWSYPSLRGPYAFPHEQGPFFIWCAWRLGGVKCDSSIMIHRDGVIQVCRLASHERKKGFFHCRSTEMPLISSMWDD